MDLIKISASVGAVMAILGAGWALDERHTPRTEFILVVEQVDHIRLEGIQVQIKRLESLPNRTQAEQEWLDSLRRLERKLLNRIAKRT